MLSDLLYRLRAVFRSNCMNTELREKLRLHLERETETYVRRGMPEHEACRQAQLALGGLEQVAEECRDSRGISALSTLWQDTRYGLRVLRMYPAFTCVAIISLALGVGANTIAFGVVNALILRSLPVPHADLLVSVQPDKATTISFPQLSRPA